MLAGNIFAFPAIQDFWLEEDHRVLARESGRQQTFCIDWCGGNHHCESRGVGEICLWAVAVEFVCSDSATVRPPNHDWKMHILSCTESRPSQMADDLIKRRIDESIELDLCDDPGAGSGHADRSANDARFAQGRVDHAIITKCVQEALGDSEYAAGLGNILSRAAPSQVEHPCPRARHR